MVGRVTETHNIRSKNAMKTKRFYRIAGSWIGLFALILLATPAIRAEEGTIPASVTIAEALTVEGLNPLEFGMLTAPSTSEAQWMLYPQEGSALFHYSGDLTSIDPIPNDESHGTFRILGTPNMSVNYTVSVTTDFANANLSLLSVGDSPDSPQVLDANGEVVVNVGGWLSILPGAAIGVHSDAVITMVANY
jgi:hypothetical protein